MKKRRIAVKREKNLVSENEKEKKMRGMGKVNDLKKIKGEEKSRITKSMRRGKNMKLKVGIDKRSKRK